MERIVRLRLVEARKSQQWTQQEVANLLGTTRYNVSRWEAGLTTPGPYFRTKISKLFGKKPQELGLFANHRTEIQQSDHKDVPDRVDGVPSTQSQQMSLWNIPYPRNPFFTGHKELLCYIHEVLNSKHPQALTQPLTINGLGGIGKTQIVLEYAYRYRNDYHYVFWTSAATREAFLADWLEIAHLLQIQEASEQDQKQLFPVIKQWFNTHQKWLLIVDDVGDLATIQDMIPMDSQGHVLLTTRTQLLGILTHHIEVERMGMVEGMLFLLHRAKILPLNASVDQATEDQLTAAEAIVITLASHPLALDQAGSYIDETGCNFLNYLNLHQLYRKELLQRRSQMSTSYSESVATTWYRDFQNIEQNNHVAANLLHLCAFLEPNVIPEELLFVTLIFQDSTINTLKFDEAIKELRRFSLIERDPKSRLLRIHPLVQIILKDTMTMEEESRWAAIAVKVTSAAFPEKVELAAWPLCRRYLPQAQACSILIRYYGFVFAEAKSLLFRTANYLSAHELHEQAEALFHQASCIQDFHIDRSCAINDREAIE